MISNHAGQICVDIYKLGFLNQNIFNALENLINTLLILWGGATEVTDDLKWPVFVLSNAKSIS
ncbi:hypothetical protein ACTXT7_003403 [Hymenolepis weldensis]